MRCIITPSGLVLQATNTDDFNRVRDIVVANSKSNYLDYETLSAIIYYENCILQIVKMLHEMKIDIIL